MHCLIYILKYFILSTYRSKVKTKSYNYQSITDPSKDNEEEKVVFGLVRNLTIVFIKLSKIYLMNKLMLLTKFCTSTDEV